MVKTLVLFVAAIGCALAFPDPRIDVNGDWRIVGGAAAADGQFPYQVSLRRSNSHFCGGSILSSRWIITAAHCVYGASPSSITIVTGSTKLNAGGTNYKVSRVVTHSGWDSGKILNDIALLEADSDIAIGGNVATIPIGKKNVGADADVVLSGWGTTSYPGSIPNDLQFLNLKTISVSDCQSKQSPNPVYDSQVCTFTKRGEGACHGDSGGPLAGDGELVGIVSWGRPCAVGYPDVFTRVSSFVDWVESNAK